MKAKQGLHKHRGVKRWQKSICGWDAPVWLCRSQQQAQPQCHRPKGSSSAQQTVGVPQHRIRAAETPVSGLTHHFAPEARATECEKAEKAFCGAGTVFSYSHTHTHKKKKKKIPTPNVLVRRSKDQKYCKQWRRSTKNSTRSSLCVLPVGSRLYICLHLPFCCNQFTVAAGEEPIY